MASLKERFKTSLKAMGAGAKEAGKILTGGAGAAARAEKKKKLRAGMMKATGQSKDQSAKIKQRTDIAAKRTSAKRKDRTKAYVDAVKTGFAAGKSSGLMKKEKKPLMAAALAGGLIGKKKK
tara:strand:+ start:53 stop:418 length:366 start_codon:yes stop_codon:yes gene_type:complete